MRAVFVVPTYNEAGTITTLLDALLDALLDVLVLQTVAAPDARMNVLVVDYSSPDGAGETVRCHSAFGEPIRLLTRTTKDGPGGVALEAAGRVLKWRILELLGRRRAVQNGSGTPADGRTSVGPR